MRSGIVPGGVAVDGGGGGKLCCSVGLPEQRVEAHGRGDGVVGQIPSQRLESFPLVGQVRRQGVAFDRRELEADGGGGIDDGLVRRWVGGQGQAGDEQQHGDETVHRGTSW